jgi:hypothetical protein
MCAGSATWFQYTNNATGGRNQHQPFILTTSIVLDPGAKRNHVSRRSRHDLEEAEPSARWEGFWPEARPYEAKCAICAACSAHSPLSCEPFLAAVASPTSTW